MTNRRGVFGSYELPVETFQVGSLSLLADGIDYGKHDRVLPIIPDEQPLICHWLQLRGTERVLDAGTGCGVLALHAASKGADALGIDVLARAIAVASENARRNQLDVRWSCEPYTTKSADAESIDVVVFNAPHHPTPRGVRVPVHAYGGSDGLEVFNDFMRAAAAHVVPGGRIVFYQLSPARNGCPKFKFRTFSG